MAKKPTADEIRRKKDARAKKAVLLLLPVLVALVAWQGPKVLKQLRGEAPPAAAADTTPAAGATTPAPGATSGATSGATTGTGTTGAETGTAPATDPNAVAVSATQGLSDTDLPPPVDEGQLVTFSRFEARDPFVQLVEGEAADGDITEANPSTSGSSTGTTPTTTPGTTGSVPPPSVQPSPSPVVPTTPSPGVSGGAKIAVNGKVHSLSVGDQFPETDPAFELVAVGTNQVTIGLANGSFSTGVQTITLNVGEPVTLISQPDGARFTLKLVSVG